MKNCLKYFLIDLYKPTYWKSYYFSFVTHLISPHPTHMLNCILFMVIIIMQIKNFTMMAIFRIWQMFVRII